uniref:Uncharacterized protein n=1 Tax=Heterosigma akashiwo TaxID=2829 RepID=A0A6V3BSR1_HETAK|mmetsp:Transcript_54876/g.80070  ORF Transcript_54876/g.80070 Transcript_54876/m.80070 type:complete len:163 (-) Transcript_54876:170-658(-)|eukprot:CAMPEP_0194577792 /NCGR_PEP_ID=MMETSP0292-20121207/12445_1 /TAXON_ID=39354 /ORGANISM="Heterosigma akashiwo, Strain CCMP2393" /LENGTH=162 /DNA_ID=CAMNT_0039430271 /DNA_START=225 /DNA_END=713 /DNA_ORIENTATION=+
MMKKLLAILIASLHGTSSVAFLYPAVGTNSKLTLTAHADSSAEDSATTKIPPNLPLSNYGQASETAFMRTLQELPLSNLGTQVDAFVMRMEEDISSHIFDEMDRLKQEVADKEAAAAIAEHHPFIFRQDEAERLEKANFQAVLEFGKVTQKDYEHFWHPDIP